MLRNTLKHSSKFFNHGSLPKTQNRSFFFRSEGDYDFFTPVLNFGMFAIAATGFIGYQVGRAKGVKEGHNATPNPSVEAGQIKESVSNKPK